MAQGDGGSSGRDIRALSRRLAEASDTEVTRAVAVVDQMPQRGGADQLIEPLRPRLAELRPPRPLRFTRLLFLPLDLLIVPPRRWQLRLPAIPRSALTALAATVRAGLGAEAAAIDAMIQAVSSQQADAVMRAGDRLWPPAAALLSAPPPPVGWADTGLNMAAYTALAGRIGAVLAQEPLLRQLVAGAKMPTRLPRGWPWFRPCSAMCGHAIRMHCRCWSPCCWRNCRNSLPCWPKSPRSWPRGWRRPCVKPICQPVRRKVRWAKSLVQRNVPIRSTQVQSSWPGSTRPASRKRLGARGSVSRSQCVDGRVEPGHDGRSCALR